MEKDQEKIFNIKKLKTLNMTTIKKEFKLNNFCIKSDKRVKLNYLEQIYKHPNKSRKIYINLKKRL